MGEAKPTWTYFDYRRRVFNGRRLSPRQAEILSLFVIRQGWRRSEIEEILWGDAKDGGPLDMGNTLDVHFKQLNQKIAPWRIRSLRNGYAILELDDVLELGENQMVSEEGQDERIYA